MKLNSNGFFLTVALVFFLAFFEPIESRIGIKREPKSDCEAKKSSIDGIEVGAEYFFCNKKHLKARLEQRGTSSRDIGTQGNSEINLKQLWVIESLADGPENRFIIRNANYPTFRLAKWGSGDREFGVYDGNYNPDQFWRFEKVGKHYRIYNHVYPSDKITKFKDDDSELGTYSGPDHDDQLWELVPRYKAKSVDSVIFSFNNGGSTNITKTISVTIGVIDDISTSLTSTLGFKQSVSASIKGIVDVSAEFRAELSSSVSRSVTTSYTKTHEIMFQIPPHVNYQVSQKKVNFQSLISSGNFQFHSLYEVRETKLN